MSANTAPTQDELDRSTHQSMYDADQGSIDEPGESYQSGHLIFEPGKGVRMIQNTGCRYCKAHGLTDGKWHSQEDLRKLEMP